MTKSSPTNSSTTNSNSTADGPTTTSSKGGVGVGGGDVLASGGRSQIRRVVLFLLSAVVVPYMVGFLISTKKIKTMTQFFQPILDPVVPNVHEMLLASHRMLFYNKNNKNYTTTTTSSSSISSIDIDTTTSCYEKFLKIVSSNTNSNSSANPWDDNPWDGIITIVLHRNGEASPCDEIRLDVLSSVFQVVLAESFNNNQCPENLFEDKYTFESLLTRVLHKALSTTSTTGCTSQEDDDTSSSSDRDGLFGFCDQGEERTVVLPDHARLTRIRDNKNTYLPCHFHNQYGVRITSLSQLTKLVVTAAASTNNVSAVTTTTTTDSHNNDDNDDGTQQQQQDCTINADGTTACAPADAERNSNNRTEFHLYAVPAGRLFIHAPAYLGQIIPLEHVSGVDPTKPISMKVISLEPKIFDIMNFFSTEESEELVQRALQETRETHRVKRSSTGATGYNVNNRRTSESGYDTDGATAMKLKRRGFELLGFDEYIDSFSDGLQILRYNLTKAYIPHLDWIDGNDKLEHNYESEFKGGNRYATILLYFTDMEKKDGGETVFTEAWPDDVEVENRKDLTTAITKLRESPQGKVLVEGSWEEEMVAKCRSRLAIQPRSARAVLFYSQLPNGKPDKKSRHGGCPVLNGTKYAANLWVWNSPRDGYSGNPKNPNFKGEKKKEESEFPGRVNGIFRNSGTDPSFVDAELYYVDQYWGPLGHGDDDISVNTYPSHVWNVKVKGEIKKTFTITDPEPKTQEFVI